jgi:hypothetical protein
MSVSAAVLDSILDSRIKQALAIAAPSDRSRLAALESLQTTASPESRIADLSDCLIEHIVALSHELQEAKSLVASTQPNSDYERALQSTAARPGELGCVVRNLIREHLQLQRLHNQDRVLLVKQSDAISAYRRKRGCKVVQEDLGEELRQISRAISRLNQSISGA